MEMGGSKISKREGKRKMDGDMEQSAEMSPFNCLRVSMCWITPDLKGAGSRPLRAEAYNPQSWWWELRFRDISAHQRDLTAEALFFILKPEHIYYLASLRIPIYSEAILLETQREQQQGEASLLQHHTGKVHFKLFHSELCKRLAFCLWKRTLYILHFECLYMQMIYVLFLHWELSLMQINSCPRKNIYIYTVSTSFSLICFYFLFPMLQKHHLHWQQNLVLLGAFFGCVPSLVNERQNKSVSFCTGCLKSFIKWSDGI